MKCQWCHREINRGTEAQKMILTYKYPDSHPDMPGEFVYVGFDRDYKKLSDLPYPGAQLVYAAHYKHFRVAEKRENRGGDAVTGRGMGSIPTAYAIEALSGNRDQLAAMGITVEQAQAMNTRELSERVQAQRTAAREAGTGLQDWKFQEQQRAKEHGGPYPHTHRGPVEDFKLHAHLLYAHGIDPLASEGGRKHQHSEAHAIAAQAATQRSREQDPGHDDAGSKLAWPGGETVTSEVSDLPVPSE